MSKTKLWLLAIGGAAVAAPVAASQTSILSAPPQAMTSEAIANVAEKRVAAVVNVSTTKKIAGRAGHPMMQDPFFHHFFGPGFGQDQPQQQRENSLGSGVIVTKDGVILTNNHVIAEADTIRVTLSDGRDFDAKVLGSDPKSDIAVLRMLKPPSDLHPITLGDSGSLRLGEMVVAIGNPFGLGHTVTMGIVSAKGRANVGIVDYEDFIQTDAAINPGNSGGALIDLRGNLVGINTAIASRSGGYQGIGFAVPSLMAKTVMNSLLKHGRVVRGWLGVSIQPVTPDLQRAMGLRTSRGVLISDIMPDSPAAKAGLERGDVLLHLDGEQLRDPAHLRNRVAAAGASSRIKLHLQRGDKQKTLVVQLGELGGDRKAERPSKQKAVKGNLAGLTLNELSSRLRRQYEISPRLKSGVVVTEVEGGSAAQRAGLREGDVLLEVNRRPVRTLADFRRHYRKSGQQTLLLVQRRGRTLFIVLNK